MPLGAEAAPGLVRGRFLRRYKRFFADIEVHGETVVAHVPNTGSMATLLHPGCDAWLAPAANPDRKLRWTLVLLGLPGGGLALVDTSLPNRIVHDGIVAGLVPSLAGFSSLRREVAIGDAGSRCDILVEGPGWRCWVEVKNCTMQGQDAGSCDFPDAVTERGAKHLLELSGRVRAGDRAMQFFLLSRSDCDRVGIARTVDPAYGRAIDIAHAAGVIIHAQRALLDPTSGCRLGPSVPVLLA